MEQVPKREKHSRAQISSPSAIARWPQAASRQHYSTPAVEHRRFLLLAWVIVIEDIMRAVWPVIEGVAHRLGFGYASHVRG
jgi:hypothetical protein